MATISSNEIHVKYVLDTGQLQAATAAMSQITAEERKLLADLKKLQDQLNAAGKTGKKAGDDTASAFGNVGKVVKELIPVLSVAFVADKIKDFSSYAFETAKRFEQMGKTLAFVSGSTEKANEQFSYMTALAQNMGLNVQSLIDGYKGFAASASFAGVSQENINRQMVSFTKAASALALSAEDTKLMFNALAQMYSKNKISAEELRQQLGERLPGSMELLAKSMKVPVSALDELMKKGEIITKDVMPAFAKEVELAFGIAADKTDTFTAAQNRLFTSLETAVVRIMEGGVGDFLKFFLNRLAAVSDLLKFLNQDALQNEQDFQSKRIVEVEKNVLYEIELFRQQYKEKYNIELTAGEAAQKLREDAKNGEKAYYEFLKTELKDIEESSNSVIDKTIRGAQKSFGTLADVVTSPIKFMGAAIKDAFLVDGGGNVAKLYEDAFKAREEAMNKGAIGDIEAAKKRQEILKYYAEDEKQTKKKQDEEDAQREGQAAKTRYQRELQMLELQEKIRRLYTQSSIENEFERSQALIKIGAEFNEKKRTVDDKYYKESFKNESQAMKDLRELTNNNSNLRKAENASFYSDLRRNEDAYHKEAYDAALKSFEKIQDARIKAEQASSKILKSEFEKEIQASNDKYAKLISNAEEQRDINIQREGLGYQERIQIFDSFTDEINRLWANKLQAQVDITDKYAKKNEQEFADMFKMIDKLYLEDFNNAKNALENQAQLTAKNAETQMLAEQNLYRSRNADEQEMNLLMKKQGQERIDNEIFELNKKLELNKQYIYANEQERIDEQNNILADINKLNEERTAIELDYADQRKQYEIQVLQESLNLANQLVSGIMDLRSQQLDQQLATSKEKADEEIRLADGNKQQIMAINERLKAEEKRIRKEQFASQQAAAIADVVFRTAPIIAQYSAGLVTAPLAIIASAAAAAQIGMILAQKVPEYAKGTQGKPHKGGPAIVGEVGVEKVVTESGKVYYTPPTATLIDLPKGAQVIPNNLIEKEEVYYATSTAANATTAKPLSSNIENQLTEIGSILKKLPVHQINLNEKGFEKYVRTEKRTTKILNNQFPSKFK